MSWSIHHGNCVDWLRSLPKNSWDFCVTDPPYGLNKPPPILDVLTAWMAGKPYDPGGSGFMGKGWDRFVPGPEAWREVHRVLKPGAYALVFAGTRTMDVMGLAMRMAGLVPRDAIAWLYGVGMPKSCVIPGWAGTALKPAFEPVLVAQKPIEKGLTLRQNAQKWGTGGLNIDACRIECSDLSGANPVNQIGRWPANVAMDGEASRQLDLFVGNRPGMSGGGKHKADYPGGMFGGIDCEHTARGDNGGPSRFFYSAKASKADKEAGLEDMPILSVRESVGREEGSSGARSGRAGAGRTGGSRNPHPTVKPTELMRWLVRLVSLPGMAGGDPFAGSGSTGVACILEGRDFMGCELNDSEKEPYVTVARKRCEHAEKRGTTCNS